MKVCLQGRSTIVYLVWVFLGICQFSTAYAEEKMQFDIPAGDARETLKKFNEVANLQTVLWGFDDVHGISTRAIHGQYTAEEALRRMTAGTPLQYEFANEQTLTLTVDRPAAAPRSAKPRGLKRNRAISGDRRSIYSGIEEITVRGTPASQTIGQLGSPLLTLSRADIEATGLTTVPDILRTLPQVFGGGPSEDTREIGFEARTNAGRGAGVNLRGLGAGSTLVLVNGRRLAGGGSEGIFVDVSNLPLSAIERIEILPDSSSTLYGADAVGGVVNFVMMDSFAGARTDAHFGAATRGQMNNDQLSQIVGVNWKGLDGLVSFDYYARDNLPAADRLQARSDLTPFGGNNFDTSQSNPGTIMVGGRSWAIPKGQDGTNLDASALVPGTQNRENRYAQADLLPMQQRWTLYATGKGDLNENVRLFGDALIGQRDVHGLSGGFKTTLPISATNPFYVNPSGTPLPVQVAYDFAADLGPLRSAAKVETLNAVAGAEWELGDTWHVTASEDFASERLGGRVDNAVDSAALAAALADPNPATALNPFGDGSHTNPATLDGLRTSLRFTTNSSLWSTDLMAIRDITGLHGNVGKLSTGAEFRQHSFRSRTQSSSSLPSAQIDLHRHVSAAFAALLIPLFGKENSHPGVERLDVSLATRYENYSDFGHIITPRFATVWAPFEGLAVRGTWSRSFRPPNLMDLDESHNTLFLFPLPNPAVPTGQSLTLVRSGRNAALQEERAKSWTLGLDLELPQVPDLSLALTYFNIDFTGRMNVPAPTADLLVNPAFSDLVTLNPTPDQRQAVCGSAQFMGSSVACTSVPVAAIVDLRVRNSASVRTNGIDFLGQYAQQGRNYTLTYGLNGTYILSFTEAESRQSPAVEVVSTQNNPIDLRFRGSVEWQHRGFRASAFITYFDDYRDIASTPHRRVRSWTALDLNLAYTNGRNAGPWLSGTTLALSVENLFDQYPPFLNNQVGIGYDQENGELTGRVMGISVRKNW